MARKHPSSTTILKELVSICSRLGPSILPLRSLNNLEKADSGPARLFRVLRRSERMSERHVSEYAVGAEPVTNKYRLVKGRLREILLNQLFHLDLKRGGYSTYAVRLFKVRRRVFQARTLRALDARRVASSIASSALGDAEELEDWSSVLDLLQVMKNDAALEGDILLYEDLDSRTRRALDLLLATHAAKSAVERMQAVFVRSGSENPESKAQLSQALESVQRTSEIYATFEIMSIELRLRGLIAQLETNYERALEICNEADRLLQKYPVFQNRARSSEQAITRIVCAIQLRDQKVGKQAIRESEGLFDESENNWYVFKEYQYLFLMQTLRFEDAHQVVMLVSHSPRLKLQSNAVQQRWELFRLYSEVLTDRAIPLMSLEALLRLVPEYKKDKGGFNFSILLLHLLILIDRRDRAGVLDRIDALKVYRRRYLKDRNNDQADLLVKLLMLLESNDLDLTRTETQQRKQGLSFETLARTDVLSGIQILPYDWLWTHIVSKVRANFPLRS